MLRVNCLLWWFGVVGRDTLPDENQCQLSVSTSTRLVHCFNFKQIFHLQVTNRHSVAHLGSGDFWFWPLDPGRLKSEDPDPGWIIRIIFPIASKHFLGFGSGMEKIGMRFKHSGSAKSVAAYWPLMWSSRIQSLQIRIRPKKIRKIF